MAAALVFVFAAISPGLGQTTPTPPDNTKANRGDQGPTADQQKENTADRELTSKVRKAITDNKALSTYAKNVKIIAQDGKVTLRCPVRSQEEKSAIASTAEEVAGTGNVTSEITIAKKRG
jgi:hyperosmotically inducible periplasmic protein